LGRPKRSETKAVVAPAVRPVTTTTAPAGKIFRAFCPVCGKSISDRRTVLRQGSVTLETQPYFESIQWDEDKPFGTMLLAAGRGSFTQWDYINPDDAPELFEAVRVRLIQAVREWINKGWLEREEILAAVTLSAKEPVLRSPEK